MRIAMTGGGTGGHIYPAISIGQALRDAHPEAELLFIGSLHGPEGRLATEAGFAFEAVQSAPLTRSLSLRNLRALAKLAAGLVRARRILKRFGAEVAVGTGGYTTAAVLIAARRLKARVVIHEQNSVPGRTNRWLARLADKVCVSFDASADYFPKSKVEVTGMPIRAEFAALPEKREARRALGLDQDQFTVLVAGGSQGARRVNELVAEALPLLWDEVQVLHQVGERNAGETRQFVDSHYAGSMPESAYRMESYVDMPAAMAAADMIVSRAGASTLAEINSAGLPSILIPYPFAYADHQRANARCLAQKGAAIVFDESSMSSQTLAAAINGLRASAGRLNDMAAASRSLARPDAAGRIAEIACGLAG